MSAPARPPRERLANALLWLLALCFPLGALSQPWLLPSRSQWPKVPRRLVAPVLLVTVDGLRADRVHHLGGARAVTPVLDDLAEHGVSFPLMFASSNEAGATLAALMTGQCGERTQVRGPGDRLRPAVGTLAARFRERGYRTAAFVADPTLAARGFDQGFELFQALPGAPAAQVVSAASAALERLGDVAWFVWVDLGDLRPPYGGPDADPRRVDPSAPAGFGSRREDYDLTAAELAARGWTPRELGWMDARYDAALSDVDAAIGTLLAPLHASGLLEMLTVAVTGTYGERLDGRPERVFTRGTDLFEDSLHVPLVLRLPAQTSRGLLPRRLAASLDVGATVFDIAAQVELPGAQGRTLRNVVLGNYEVNRYLFSQGSVQDAPGAPRWIGTAVRNATTRVLLDDTGTARAAWRLDKDPRQEHPFGLQPMQVREFLKGFDKAAPEQSACLPHPR